MITLDFTTTAVARPDIINRTYASFSKRLTGIDLKNCRLFINIDPVPSDVDRKEVAKVAKKYFKEVYPNYPEVANYTAAYNWVWSNANTDYIFNLEDDWELVKKVSIKILLNYFKKHKNLLEVALRAYNYNYKACPTSPSIMHKRYYKAVAGKLNEKVNPESQLRGSAFGIALPSPSFNISAKGKLVAYPEDRNEIIVKDIGRKWIKNSNYIKPEGSKKNFTSWDLKPDKKKKMRELFKPIKIKKVKRKNDTITQLADKYGCDKNSLKHDCGKLYTDYFYTVRNKKFKMLEIGFGKGASVRIWLDYFKNITLYCVDIREELPDGFKQSIDAKRLQFINADQSSIEELSKIFNDNAEDFGIIIDDGSHVSEDQMLSFGYLFPRLCSGGVYVIENLNCKREHNKKFNVEEDRVINILKKFQTTGKLNSKILTKTQIKYIKKHIAGVKIYKNKIVFITKV